MHGTFGIRVLLKTDFAFGNISELDEASNGNMTSSLYFGLMQFSVFWALGRNMQGRPYLSSLGSRSR